MEKYFNLSSYDATLFSFLRPRISLLLFWSKENGNSSTGTFFVCIFGSSVEKQQNCLKN